jgi:hypothetical protein
LAVIAVSIVFLAHLLLMDITCMLFQGEKRALSMSLIQGTETQQRGC